MSHAQANKLRATMGADERLADIEKRLVALERAEGKKGTGACICKASPALQWRSAFRMIEDPRASKHYPLMLDHRCAHHGEEAQPKLWGRMKDKELLVTWAQWDSLGIAYTPEDEATKQPFDGAAALAAAKARA